MAAKFEIQTGKDDQFYWHFKAANGEIVCHSEGYTTKDSAMTGIEAVKHMASGAVIQDNT